MTEKDPAAKNDNHLHEEAGDHLSAAELELYASGSLSGAEILDVLIHLETCDECFQKLPHFNEDEFLEKLFGEDAF